MRPGEAAGHTSRQGLPGSRPGARRGLAAPPGSGCRSPAARDRRTAARAASVRARGSTRWPRRATPGRGAAGTCSAGAARGCGQRPCRRGCGTDPAPLPPRWWDANGNQLAGAVQPGQPPAVTTVGLDLVTGCFGDQRRRDHLAADAHAVQQPGELEPGRAGLVAGSQPAGVTQAANEPADRWLVVGDPVDLGDLLVGGENSHRDRVAVDTQTKMDRGKVRDTGHGRLLPYVGSARSVLVTHADADWSRPFHAD